MKFPNEVKVLFYGNLLLFSFYFQYLKKLFNLHEYLWGWDRINDILKSKKKLEFSFSNSLANDYNLAIKDVGEQLRKLENNREETFIFKMILFFILRLFCVATAYKNWLEITIILSLMQFFILPYSLFVSFAKIVELFPPLFMSSMIVFPLLGFLKSLILPEYLDYNFEINDKFIICFFFIDQLLCLICTFVTPRGKSAPMTLERNLKSLFFGFINTKTYFLILLFLLRGVKISLVVWLFDAFFDISGKISVILSKKLSCWEILFYHQHRIAHLPYVYQDAHKFHHFLSDTSPFDAHIYGSGAPEEWHSLMIELIPSIILKIVPPSLTYHVLKISWSNKVAHTRNQDGSNGQNQHADHHLFHVKNYCWYPALEMYMGTCTNNHSFKAYDYDIKRICDDDKMVFKFSKEEENKND